MRRGGGLILSDVSAVAFQEKRKATHMFHISTKLGIKFPIIFSQSMAQLLKEMAIFDHFQQNSMFLKIMKVSTTQQST